MSLIRHVRHKAVIVVRSITDVLRPSVGQEDGVGALYVARAVRIFRRVKVGARVGVLDAVAVGVRQRFVLHRELI
jgi:hypothetical protein